VQITISEGCHMLNKKRDREFKFIIDRKARENSRKDIPVQSKKRQYLLAAILIILTLSSCDNTFSIFQSIGQEVKQLGAELFKGTTVRAMGSDATNYYALMSKVVYKPKSGVNWDVLPIDGDTDYFSPGLASDGNTIYVAKADLNANLKDIYSSTDGGKNWTGMDAKNDIQNVIGAGNNFCVDWLKCENNTLFVAFHSSAGYSLFYYDVASTSFKNAFSTISSLSEPLVDIVWDGSTSAPGKYWLISSSKVYSGVEGSIDEDSSPNNPALSKGLKGIASDGAGRILVSRSDGKIYDYASGNWSNFLVKSSSELGPLILLDQPSTSKRILVAMGTSTSGYMECDENGSIVYENGVGFISTSQSIYNSTVRAKQVEGFWQPVDDSNTLFALLAAGSEGSYALYRNTYSEGAWSGWIAE